ncbi:MAG: tetratricopeptide repeat protein [Spirochaetaceae bacterium]|nr:tetratricopeptide repeat protein [Spirochaetaceae bacterium]
MSISSRFGFRYIAYGILLFLLLGLTACGSTPKPEVVVEEPSPATPLFVPEITDQGFFVFSDKTIMPDMEIGSPDSIRLAVSKIKNPTTQPEKIIVAVASQLMSIVWPSEQNTIEIPSDIEANAYTAAIESAKVGIYDVNTGNTDFFTTVLPSLVLLTSSSQTDYYLQSLSALQAGLEMQPNSVLVHYLLGCLYQKMGNLDSSLEMYEKASSLAEDCLEVNYAFSEVNYLKGNYGTAQETAGRMLTVFPGNLKLLKLLAQIATKMRDYAVAENYINQVLQQEPDNAQFLLLRVEVLMDQGSYVKAVSLLDVYSRVDKVSKDYLLLRSRIQNEWNKNSIAAAATAEQALELYPNDTDVILAAANLAAATGSNVQGKSAGQLAAEILAKDPDNEDAIFIRAKDAVVRKNWEMAYNDTSQLINKGNASLSRKLLYVEACLGANRIEEAQRIVGELYKEYPESDDAKELYMRVQAAAGNNGEVRSLIASMLPSASSQLNSFLYYQRSMLATNDSDKLADLRQSLTANPRNSEALFELYRYYFERKDYRKAQYYLKQVVALNTSDEEMLRLNLELEALLQ